MANRFVPQAWIEHLLCAWPVRQLHVCQPAGQLLFKTRLCLSPPAERSSRPLATLAGPPWPGPLLSRSQLLAVALCTPDLQQTLATLAYLLSRELHRDCGSSRSQFSPWRTLTPHSKSNSVSTLLEAACPEMSPSEWVPPSSPFKLSVPHSLRQEALSPSVKMWTLSTPDRGRGPIPEIGG